MIAEYQKGIADTRRPDVATVWPSPSPENEFRTIKFTGKEIPVSYPGDDKFAAGSASTKKKEEGELEVAAAEGEEGPRRNRGNKNVGNESPSGENQTVNEYGRDIHEEAGTFGRRGY